MVSVHAFHTAKTTDEADNHRSNLIKDNFALHGSLEKYQQQLFLYNHNSFFFDCAFLSGEVWFACDILCDCPLVFKCSFRLNKYFCYGKL